MDILGEGKLSVNNFQKQARLPLFIRLRIYQYLPTDFVLLISATLCKFDRDEIPKSTLATDRRVGELVVSDECTRFFLNDQYSNAI